MKKGRMYEVWWVDHTLAPYSEQASLALRRSVGYLMGKDKRALYISQTLDNDGTGEECLALARPLVVKVKRRQ